MRELVVASPYFYVIDIARRIGAEPIFLERYALRIRK